MSTWSRRVSDQASWENRKEGKKKKELVDPPVRLEYRKLRFN